MLLIVADSFERRDESLEVRCQTVLESSLAMEHGQRGAKLKARDQSGETTVASDML